MKTTNQPVQPSFNAALKVEFQNASITFLYRDLQIAGTDQLNLYRAEFNYKF